MKNKISIYTDGGARGNPGPAGIGVVIELSSGKQEFSEYIGSATNNVAEYRALILALKKLKEIVDPEELGKSQVNFYADSELMVKQLNGHYKVKDLNLRELFMEVVYLKNGLKTPVAFHHIRREKNAEADALVNEVLDKATGQSKV